MSSRLRITNAETPGIPTSYLRASSDTVEYDHEPRKVAWDEAIIPSGHWTISTEPAIDVHFQKRDVSEVLGLGPCTNDVIS